ncbi:MAG: hypothetical protein HRT38_19755 [Alteromonadaceae bacterium]|nr:hypothetical protein [Alteromonadaceae bacterium]
MNVIKIIIIGFALLTTMSVNASMTCSGRILEVVKWSGLEDISIMLENTGRYIKFTDKTAISMILTAFSTQKNVVVLMDYDSVTSCNEGWTHYTIHKGYLKVER